MELFWTVDAIHDRESIFDYIEQDNPLAALNLDQLFSDQAMRLVDHPKLGKLGRIDGTYELVVHHNFVLVYDLDGDMVRVLRVLHCARQFP